MEKLIQAEDISAMGNVFGEYDENIKLIERRNKIGLTQVEVAKKAGVSERAYQSYEAGKRQPNVQTAKLIAKVLKSTVEKLF